MAYIPDFSLVLPYWRALTLGFIKTLELSLWSCVVCFILVLLAYAVRFSLNGIYRSTLEAALKICIDVVQALPVLVALVWIYFGLPIFNIRLSADLVVELVLGVSFSAFALDLFMAAEKAVSREQIHVATLHNVSAATIVSKIYLPTILSITADPLVGQIIGVVKLSTFASIIGSQEILSISNGVISTTYRPLEVYTVVAGLFVVSIVPINLLRRTFSHRASRKGEIS